MTEVLVGSAESDFKIGQRSARLRGHATSVMTMTADKTGGIGTISFEHRRFGNDTTQVEWIVEYTLDEGTSWTEAGKFTAGAEVATFTAAVNRPGSARVRIRTAATGTTDRRANVDDLLITDFFGPAAPATPTASDVTGSGFTVNWTAVEGATGYRLDVATDAQFASFVEGFEDLAVTGTSREVGGLAAETTYYVRLRAVNAEGTSNNSGTLTQATGAAGLPLPGGARVELIDGSYVIVDGEGSPLVGASYTYSYAGRSVGGLTEAYAFLSYSSVSAPTAPGFYTVTVTAGGEYTGSLEDHLFIDGPLALPVAKAIERTKIAGATTVRFNRSALLGALQRVTAEGTLATGATGLSWTGVMAGESQMPAGFEPTMSNTVTSSASFVTLTPPGGGVSDIDSFNLTVSDGKTPVTFDVTVASTEAPPFDLQIRKLVAIEGDPNNMRAIFLTRPNRTVQIEFSTDNDNFEPVRDPETALSLELQAEKPQGETESRPPAAISSGSTGVLEFRVPREGANLETSMSFRARPVLAPPPQQ
jgi:hypothetical protein